MNNIFVQCEEEKMNRYEQLYLVLLYEVLKSKEPNSFSFQTTEIYEEYESSLQKWNEHQEYSSPLYNRLTAQFHALKENKMIIASGQDGSRIKYKISVEDESERLAETLQKFEEYVEKLQEEIAANEEKNLILSEKLVSEILLYHAEGQYLDYYIDLDSLLLT